MPTPARKHINDVSQKDIDIRKMLLKMLIWQVEDLHQVHKDEEQPANYYTDEKGFIDEYFENYFIV